MQVKMARNLARWHPAPDEDWRTVARRGLHWSQVHYRRAGIPRWDHAIGASWWRARRGMQRSCQRANHTASSPPCSVGETRGGGRPCASSTHEATQMLRHA